MGQWLASRAIPRAEVVIIGKACHPYGGQPRLSLQALQSDVADSLERLGLAYIDVLLLHRDDCVVEVEEVAGWMDQMVRSGRVREWGTSNWSPHRRRALVAAARRLGAPFLAVRASSVRALRVCARVRVYLSRALSPACLPACLPASPLLPLSLSALIIAASRCFSALLVSISAAELGSRSGLVRVLHIQHSKICVRDYVCLVAHERCLAGAAHRAHTDT